MATRRRAADRRPTVPPGTPRWGAEWKKATAKWYHHAARFNTSGFGYANRDNFIDLDPTYKDILGRPLIRMTYNFPTTNTKCRAICCAKLEGSSRP